MVNKSLPNKIIEFIIDWSNNNHEILKIAVQLRLLLVIREKVYNDPGE